MSSKVTRTKFFLVVWELKFFSITDFVCGLQAPAQDFLKPSLNSYMRLFKALLNLIYQHFIFSTDVEMSPFWESLPLYNWR